MPRTVRAIALAGILSLAVTSQWAAASPDFETDVRPILAEHCVKCHGPEKQKGGVRFDSRDSALKGGDSGEPAVVPGRSAESLLIELVTTEDDGEVMPPKGDRLSAAQVDVLRRWIDSGAEWPTHASANATLSELKVTEEDRQHWAFRPFRVIQPPEVMNAGRVSSAVDRFVFARLERQGETVGVEADRTVLVRRLFFNLIGLPPTPEEVEAFVQDESPDAYESLVERLLASPHYGERWGRHWLDAARYADSAGFEEDRPRPNAYHYRDFVIRAFNDDLPYDEFVRWQIAGDLLEPDTIEASIATGFLTAGPDVRPDFINFRKKDRFDELDDILSTTGSAMLGLTIGCARCHDHKYDPIPARDYYRLLAFFTSTERVERPLDPQEAERHKNAMKAFEARLALAKGELEDWLKPHIEALRDAKISALAATEEEKMLLRAPRDERNAHQRELLERFKNALAIDDDAIRSRLSDTERTQWEMLRNAIAEVEKERPDDIARVLTIRDGEKKKTHLLVRGDPDSESDEMLPGVLTVLSREPSPHASDSSSWKSESAGDSEPGWFGSLPEAGSATRADLAKWMTDTRGGAGVLLARVIVNRVWQHHFGRGLIATPGDFGVRGEMPDEPELLDWLAAELVRNGWRLKHLHRLILNSATWKMAERKPLRVEAEILRDSILAVSGTLNPTQFGPAVKPRMETEAIAVTAKDYDRWPENVIDGPETWRRSVYVFVKRSNLYSFLQTFDAPNAIGSCARRNVSTVATQALTLLNDQFVREQAKHFAQRLMNESPEDVGLRLTRAWQLAFSRMPSERELGGALAFIEKQTKQHREDGVEQPVKAALVDLCQALFAANEFSYVQ